MRREIQSSQSKVRAISASWCWIIEEFFFPRTRTETFTLILIEPFLSPIGTSSFRQTVLFETENSDRRTKTSGKSENKNERAFSLVTSLFLGLPAIPILSPLSSPSFLFLIDSPWTNLVHADWLRLSLINTRHRFLDLLSTREMYTLCMSAYNGAVKMIDALNCGYSIERR